MDLSIHQSISHQHFTADFQKYFNNGKSLENEQY
jgi:hypothetical protein